MAGFVTACWTSSRRGFRRSWYVGSPFCGTRQRKTMQNAHLNTAVTLRLSELLAEPRRSHDGDHGR
jgi:hypothetical protein